MHIETARSHQTLANLSHLPDEAIAALRLVLGGKTVVDADAALQVERSAGHGHVAAVHTIARQLGVAGASTDEVYQAMDWLVGRQDHIEAELARRHLQAGGIAMFDLSSSWME